MANNGLDDPRKIGECKCPEIYDCVDFEIKGVKFDKRGPPNYAPKPDTNREYVQKVIDPEVFRSDAIRNAEKKHKFTNLERYIHTQRNQCEEIAKKHRAIEEQAQKERDMEEANAISRELDAIKRQEFKDAKLRQQLRANSQELQQLERQLKAAYVNKELAAQIAQHEAVKLNEKIHAARTHETMMKAWVTERQHLDNLKKEDIVKKAAYKKELQDQIIMREKSKRYLYEQFLREKKIIDEIVQRIHDEDERERIEKMNKMKKTREEIEAIRRAQEEWKKKRQEEIEDEDRKIREYILSRSSEQQSKVKEQAEKVARRDKIIEKIASELVEERDAKRERDEVVQDLREEELRAKMDKRHKQEVEKKLRTKLQTKKTLTEQMEETQERLRSQQEEDRKYKEELMAKCVEDQKLEQLSKQNRRLKMIQMRKDIQALLAERRAKHAEEFQLQIRVEEDERREADQRKQIIEEERMNMLKEHVQNLIGYLPKGFLRPDDLVHLGPVVLENLQASNPLPTYIPPVHRKR